MSKYRFANAAIDAALERSGSTGAVDRRTLERRIHDKYVITLSGLGAGRPQRWEIDEAQAALRSGVSNIIDRRLRAKCSREVHSRRLSTTVAKTAANSFKRSDDSASLLELTEQTGVELAEGKKHLQELANQVNESVELRKGALIYFKMTDTPRAETLSTALAAAGKSEDEFYANIAV